MTTPAQGNAILALLQSDLLTAAGTPLLTFLTAMKTAGTNPLAIAAAWVQLQGELVGAAPGLESALSAQIFGALQTKLAATIAAAQAAAPKL
jgi:hypothetical protein